VHFFGVSLGGLLAQQYAMARPSRVSSIILCNSFFSTTSYIPTAGSMVTSMYAVTPYFVLKNMLLTSFNNDAAAISASVSGTLASSPCSLRRPSAHAPRVYRHTHVCASTRAHASTHSNLLELMRASTCSRRWRRLWNLRSSKWARCRRRTWLADSP
jgi:pimeloyl-ACP methyl ester carboxylesterase